MSVFLNDTDAIKFAVRKLYHDVLHREIESQAAQNWWVQYWVSRGGDATLAAIMDSPEGQHRMAQERALLDHTPTALHQTVSELTIPPTDRPPTDP